MKKFVDIIVVFIAVLLLQSCESNLKDVQRIYKTSFVPTGEADSINLKYTDITNFDFTKLYFIKQLGNYYLVNKIINFRMNETTNVELIKVEL